jgi:transposase
MVLGVDVSKAELVGFSGGRLFRVKNTASGIRELLERVPGTCVAMEATGSYHLALADMAFAAGHRVYVLNPKDVARYKSAVAPRGKTDPLDAEAIARYVSREGDSLRPYIPLSPEQRRLRSLLLRRCKLVQAKVKVRQSLETLPELRGDLKGIVERMDACLLLIDGLIDAALSANEHYTRLQQIPGVGRLTAASLVCALERGTFARGDSFVSFLGLDPLPRDSGAKQGRRRLSKLGDAHTRRLAFLAAMAAARTSLWKPLYERFRVRLSTTEALVALSRRIVRTAWSMCRYMTDFDPERARPT